MKRLLAPALLAPALLAGTIAAPAHAQYYYDPGRAQAYDRQLPDYSDDEGGYSGGYSARSDDMRPGYAPPAPPGTNGGYRNDGGYAGYGGGYGAPGGYPQAGGYAEGGYDGADAPPPPPAPRSTRPAARSPYADRIARWRARADACEAGDRTACEGPE